MTIVAELVALDALVETVRAAGPPPPDPESAPADELAAAVEAWHAPVRVRVTGRSGVGKTTVAAALGVAPESETEAIDDAGPTRDPVLDGDLVIYVLAGCATAADRSALATVAADTAALVVLNKVDALSRSWPTALTIAARHSETLGVQTLPLIGSLAARTRTHALTDAEARSLRQLAAVADVTLTLSPELFLAVHVGTDVRARRTMLQRWDLYGIDCALGALRTDKHLTAPALSRLLHAATGVEAVHAAMTARIERAMALRGGALLDTIARLAARAVPESGNAAGPVLEGFLRGDPAARIGLAAGLACPDIADIAAEYPGAEPIGPDDALRRADRWRIVAAAGDTSVAGQRAARRIHQGYIRAWERMSFGAGS